MAGGDGESLCKVCEGPNSRACNRPWEPEAASSGAVPENSRGDPHGPSLLSAPPPPGRKQELIALLQGREKLRLVVKDGVTRGELVPPLKLGERLRGQITGSPLTLSAAGLPCWKDYKKEGKREIILPHLLVVSDLMLP